jgi:hypothetical protein
MYGWKPPPAGFPYDEGSGVGSTVSVTGPVATGPTWFHKNASFSSEKSSLASVVLAADALYVVEE